MANICGACGEPMTAGQCKCQAFSEVPLPSQTKHLSTDGAIREGEPPHKPVTPAKSESPNHSGMMVMCALIGAVVGTVLAGAYVADSWAKSDTPIGSPLVVFLLGGFCVGALPGLVLGFVVSLFLMARTASGSDKGSTQS
jgi:F0F1-type ATP synthase assembly protein I